MALTQSSVEERFDRIALVAQAGLQRWVSFVRPLPVVLVREEQRAALRALVNWYERVCVDEDYASTAPADGIEVLCAVCSSRARPVDDPLTIARGAVGLAGELVDYRRLLIDYRNLLQYSEGPPELLEDELLSQLEVATQSVFEFLDVPC